jgi:hypothetical protein
MSDLKTSLLVNRQLPEFVRDEHPKFVLFLEAYYEFLDQSGYGKAKELRNVPDVDVSLQEFEQQFFNTFLPFIPRDTAVSKEVLIKNILPLYLSKGSERSYRLLFRLLFDQEIGVENPGSQILRASDGRWSQESVLRVDPNIYSEYVYDGSNNVFYLPYVVDKSGFEVFINGTLTDSFEYRLETRKVILQGLSTGDVIRIQYRNFNSSILSNLQILGKQSGASAVVEKASRTNIGGLNFYQLITDSRTIAGSFIRAEVIECKFKDNGNTIPIFFKPYSGLLKIDIINGGSSYNIGDTVIVRGPAEIPAIAFVDDVVSGTIDGISVIEGGTGFKVNNQIFAQGFDESFFTAQVLSVDDTGRNSTNTISYNTDIIEDYLDVSIDSEDYGFPIDGVEDLDTVISDALSSNVITGLGPVTSATVLNSQISSSVSPVYLTESSLVSDNLRISDLGYIGRIDIIDGGQDYQVGDQLTFINTESFSGQGASAEVSEVDDNGSIVSISITNPGLSYQLEYLPTIQVESENGFGANIVVSSLLGTGATYESILDDGVPGEIKSIRVLSQGAGYEIIPGVDLSFAGDGNATGVATLSEPFVTLQGKWKTSDSILSDDQIRLQGRDYYIPYSYVISSKVEFNKYKDLLKNLLHPSGLINYSKYRIDTTVEVDLSTEVVATVQKTVSGTVNIETDSNVVTGTNTNFVVAQSLGIIDEDSVIVINDEIRTVTSIDDETTLTVDSEYTTNSVNNIVKILS